MSLKIIKAGILDHIQDRGRYGYQHYGINPNGAMDVYSMQVANILVGNPVSEAIIEMHFPCSVFLFTSPAIIAISGADFSPRINGETISINQPVVVTKNDILHFDKPVTGARAYLSFKGGLEIPFWLNSASTNFKAKAGGFKGRQLLKDDEIKFRPDFLLNLSKYKMLSWIADISWNADKDGDHFYVLRGNEWEYLTKESQEQFLNAEFVISPQSDRMGTRIKSDLESKICEELVSSAVSFGTIQLLPAGEMIILGADHQTTGGYPRIAHIISAHHSKLAQKKPGDKIRFKMTGIQPAESLFQKQQQHLHLLKNACSFKLNEYLKK
jgi:antagonist of KipI